MRRRALGLCTADLAVRCGMTRNTVERLEQGLFLPTPSQAYQLALVRGLDPVSLGSWVIRELLLHPEFLCEHVSQTAA